MQIFVHDTVLAMADVHTVEVKSKKDMALQSD